MLARLGYISVLEYGMPRTPVALDRLDVNPIGLCGMLGIAGEWCTDNRVQDAARNRVCYWQDYFTNYNNDISYSVQTRVLGDTDTQRFRVVRGQAEG
jgi:formylglycine-generating enzyme required for sulfatase activity